MYLLKNFTTRIKTVKNLKVSSLKTYRSTFSQLTDKYFTNVNQGQTSIFHTVVQFISEHIHAMPIPVNRTARILPVQPAKTGIVHYENYFLHNSLDMVLQLESRRKGKYHTNILALTAKQ